MSIFNKKVCDFYNTNVEPKKLDLCMDENKNDYRANLLIFDELRFQLEGQVTNSNTSAPFIEINEKIKDCDSRYDDQNNLLQDLDDAYLQMQKNSINNQKNNQ